MLFFIQNTSSKYVIKVIFQHYLLGKNKMGQLLYTAFLIRKYKKQDLRCVPYLVGPKMACFVHFHQVRVIKR